MRSWSMLVPVLAGVFVCGGGSRIGPDEPGRDRPYTPAVSMMQDARTTLQEFARRHGIKSEEMRRRVGAVGLVRCGAAVGTGQLTLRRDLITTAAHVLLDEHGRKRKGCVFEPVIGGKAVPLAYDSIQTGSRLPLAEPATRDWAVARLVAPVSQVLPFAIGSADAMPVPVLMCAGGNKAFASIGTESCTTQRVIGRADDGIRELTTDCNAGPGSSGAALVAGNKIVGIYVGYRSDNPAKAQPFSATHYNFAISLEGPFRRALLAAAGQ